MGGICEANSNPNPKKTKEERIKESNENYKKQKAEKENQKNNQPKNSPPNLLDKFQDFPEWEGITE